MFDLSILFGDICDQSRKLSKIPIFLHALVPMFFWEGGGKGPPPEFLDMHYKALPFSDHVAKFHGDRSRDLGERVAK